MLAASQLTVVSGAAERRHPKQHDDVCVCVVEVECHGFVCHYCSTPTFVITSACV